MKHLPLARIGAYPHIPPGTAGWYTAWCAFEGINPYHPERMTPAQRAQYEEAAGEPPPPRNPYRTDPCHPLELGWPSAEEAAPWQACPGATMAARCLSWLEVEFGRRQHTS